MLYFPSLLKHRSQNPHLLSVKKKTPWSPSNSQWTRQKAISKTWSTPASIIMKLKTFGSTSALHKVGSLTQWSLRAGFIGPLKRYLLEGWPCRRHFINQAFKVKWLDRSHSRKKTSDSPIGICQTAFSRTPRASGFTEKLNSSITSY